MNYPQRMCSGPNSAVCSTFPTQPTGPTARRHIMDWIKRCEPSETTASAETQNRSQYFPPARYPPSSNIYRR